MLQDGPVFFQEPILPLTTAGVLIPINTGGLQAPPLSRWLERFPLAWPLPEPRCTPAPRGCGGRQQGAGSSSRHGWEMLVPLWARGLGVSVRAGHPFEF